MKKLIQTGLLLLCAYASHAQEQIRIWQADGETRVTTEEITFNNGSSLTINGKTYETAAIDSMAIVHTVTVTYSGGKALVDLGHAPGVKVETDGAHVNLVSTNGKHELEFVLRGQSDCGSLTYTGPLKCKFYLDGLNLKSDRGAALDIECGKRVDLILNPGTDNVLADAAGGDQKAALYCKGHLEVEGSGSLTVTGNAKHGIATKEYLQLKKSTGKLTVSGAASDAIHAGQYFLMNGGTLTLTGQKADGLQVETLTLDDDVTPDASKENNGQCFVNGGTITVAVDQPDVKGIKVPGNMTIHGGSFNITATGAGSKGISVGGNMLIDQEVGTTTIQIKATGGVYEDAVTDEETRCMGIKVSGNLTINAGTVRVSNTGTGSRGIKIDGIYKKGAAASVSANIKN